MARGRREKFGITGWQEEKLRVSWNAIEEIFHGSGHPHIESELHGMLMDVQEGIEEIMGY